MTLNLMTILDWTVVGFITFIMGSSVQIMIYHGDIITPVFNIWVFWEIFNLYLGWRLQYV